MCNVQFGVKMQINNHMNGMNWYCLLVMESKTFNWHFCFCKMNNAHEIYSFIKQQSNSQELGISKSGKLIESVFFFVFIQFQPLMDVAIKLIFRPYISALHKLFSNEKGQNFPWIL